MHGLECPCQFISMLSQCSEGICHMFDKHKKSFSVVHSSRYPDSQEITSRGQAAGPCELLCSGRGDTCRLHYQGAKPKIRSVVAENRTIVYKPLKNTWTWRCLLVEDKGLDRSSLLRITPHQCLSCKFHWLPMRSTRLPPGRKRWGRFLPGQRCC